MSQLSLIPGDLWRDPADVLSAVADEPWAIGFLSDGIGERGRWSYLARRPEATLIVRPEDEADPFAALVSLLGPPLKFGRARPLWKTGVAGLAAYELGDRTERLGLERLAPWPDLACARYVSLLAFDHHASRIWGVGLGDDGEQQAAAALQWLNEPPAPVRAGPLADGMTPTDPGAYERAVAEVVGRIAAGEIFQANVARRWRGRLSAGARPYDVLQRLREASPAPFAAYLRLPGLAVVSNAPERFVRVAREDGGLVAESRPIKGTRRRGRDAAEDARLAAELAASAKDRAENLMIVDLMRNDLARVCAAGSVDVPELCRVETFANVHHLVSSVTGVLAQGMSSVDLLKAAFPPGSITGAPKVQAMKVIAELEPPRGPFFGSMFWSGLDGAFDSSVLIRTAGFVEDAGGWSVEARAGAGLVADSQPCEERRETETKISALLNALEGET